MPNLCNCRRLTIFGDPVRCSAGSFRRLGRSMNHNSLTRLRWLMLKTFEDDLLAMQELTDNCSHDHWESSFKYAGKEALARLTKLSRSGRTDSVCCRVKKTYSDVSFSNDHMLTYLIYIITKESIPSYYRRPWLLSLYFFFLPRFQTSGEISSEGFEEAFSAMFR